MAICEDCKIKEGNFMAICEDCKFIGISSFSCGGENIHSYSNKCLHPSLIKYKKSPIKRERIYADCEIQNKKYNCKLFALSKYKFTPAGFQVKANPSLWNKIIYTLCCIDYKDEQ